MNTKAPGSPSALRRSNLARVVAALRGQEVMTQAEVTRRTGLSPATVSSIVRELTTAGRVEVVADGAGRRGRSLRLTPETGLAVGVDFGHTHVRVAVAGMDRQVLAERSRPIDVGASAEAGLAAATGLLAEMLAELDASLDEVVGVGMGVPGPIDTTSGTVGSSAILPGWVGVHAAAELEQRLGRPVLVDNDANLGALAEATWGAARHTRHAAYVKVASGLGSGLVIDGQVYRGVSGSAGEIGHVTVDEGGPLCRCGNRGCAETYTSTERLVRDLAVSHGDISVERMLELCAAGDPGAQRVIADAGHALGRAVASLVNLVNPEVVVVGGQLAEAGEVLLGAIRRTVSRTAVSSAARSARIVASELGGRAELLGALALVLTSPLAGASTVPGSGTVNHRAGHTLSRPPGRPAGTAVTAVTAVTATGGASR